MNRLAVLLLSIVCFAPMGHACEQAIAQTRMVQCYCTGQNVNATVCQGTLDNDYCTSYVDPQYCGSSGSLDCYVGGAEDGCIDRVSSSPIAIATIIRRIDSLSVPDHVASTCGAAGLPSIDDWFASRGQGKVSAVYSVKVGG